MTVLAIDQGTTSTKAFLLFPDGRFETVGSFRHRQILPAAGAVEHDAGELICHIRALIEMALDRAADIKGIALANQGETVVAFDRASGEPLHNAIVWQDQRTQDTLDALPARDRALINAISGLPVDAYFSASKLRWLLDNVADARALAVRGALGLATSDAYFLTRLTGAYLTDPTTASRTSLLSLADCRWSPELSDVFGVPLDLLPPIIPTTGHFGTVNLRGREIPIVASVVDQQAALFGHGCRDAGDLEITFGTGTFALAVSGNQPVLSSTGLVPTVAWQNKGEAPVFALDAGDYTAAAAVDWAISVGLAASIDDFELPDGPSALERGVVFVPSLAGLAAPHWDRAAAGAFLGLRQNTTSVDLRRAVLEGIALRAVELIEALAPNHSGTISIDGGLANNRGFVRFLADAIGRPVILRSHTDLTALGAAELGYVGLGLPMPRRTDAEDVEVSPSAASGLVRYHRRRFANAIAAVRGVAADRHP